MSEVDSSPENPKIPENWDIPRDLVNNPKSKAIQVDDIFNTVNDNKNYSRMNL